MATVYDVPDLQFTGESLDVSCEIEAFLTGLPLATTDEFDLSACRPVDIASPWKPGKTAAAPFDITAAVGIPYLTPESISYRFGLRDNARQTFGLRGDSIFYCPGPVYVQSATGSGSAGQTITLTNVAGVYTDSNGSRRVLSLMAGTKRLTYGVDYTVTEGTPTGGYASVDITIVDAVPNTDTIQVMYFSNVAQSYPQTVHQDTTVKPAAIKGKDIDVYVGGYDPADIPGSAVNKLISVQSANADWRVQLEKDEEFGNPQAVGQDYDVPTVNGSIDIKPRDVAEVFTRLSQITGTAATEAIGPNSGTPLELDIVLKHPETGATQKRLHVPDARFTVPGYQGRVQQKLTLTLPFESDGGQMSVFQDLP